MCEFTESESTLSKTIKNSKVIGNRKYKKKEKSKDITGKQSEDETIVNYLKEDDAFVKSLNLNKDEYNTSNFIQERAAGCLPLLRKRQQHTVNRYNVRDM